MRSKSSGITSKTFELRTRTPGISILKKRVKTRQYNYFSNVTTIFGALDRNFEILEYFYLSKIRSWDNDTSW